MAVAARSVPDLETLAGALAAMLDVSPADGIRILGRYPNAYASTFPSETVHLSVRGSEMRVFCKYTGGRSHTSFGHRGDVAYEARVYESILAGTSLTVPAFVGSFDDAGAGTVLVIEHVADAVLADEARSPERALERAAAWLVRLREETAAVGNVPAYGFLRRYDADYYRQWARRTVAFAGHWHDRLPWLSPLCERFEALADDLAAAPTAFVHGEFVPHNILVRGSDVYPIDWESAALGLAEIDLVSVTDKWPEELARRCEAVYRAGTAIQADAAELDRRLDMARVYWDLRWLGDRPEWTVLEKVGARFEHLRQAGGRLGMLG